MSKSIRLKKDRSSARTKPMKGRLILEDGSHFDGIKIGSSNMEIGEVCFNTSMTGYQEIITDPSYKKQIITFTHPHIGNTGINHEDNESNIIHASGIVVKNFRCTKVMSKIVRTYTDSHGLKNLCEELLGIELSKQQQQTNWASPNLTQKQLEYAASDVYYLIEIYHHLEKMMSYRPPLSSGKTVNEINDIAQKILPGLVQILIHGYGDRDQGWETSLFAH